MVSLYNVSESRTFIKTNDVSLSEKFLFVLLLSCFLFRIHMDSISAFVATYLSDALFLTLSVFALLKHRIPSEVLSKQFTIVGAFSLLLIIPLGINIIFCNGTFGSIFDYVKILYYLYAFVVIKTLIIKYGLDDKFINKGITIFFYLNCLVALIQLLSLPVLSTPVYLLFGQNKLRDIYSGYSRVYSTFYNANWFGVYLIFMFSFFNELFFSKQISGWNYLINVTLLAAMLLVSGSRTAILGCIVAIGVQSLLNFKFKNIMLVIFLGIPLVWALISIASNIEVLTKTFNRFVQYFDSITGQKMTLETLGGSRYLHWETAINIFKEYPLFGKANSELINHNSYLTFLLDFGAIGLGFVVIPIFIGLLKTHKTRINKQYKTTIAGFVSGFLMVCIAGDYLFCTQIMLLIVFVVALRSTFRRRGGNL